MTQEETDAGTPGSGRIRVPDGINREARTLSEVKNRAKLSYTQQLRDFAAFAKDQGLDFILYVRDDTKLSKPLLEAIDRGEIKLLYIPAS